MNRQSGMATLLVSSMLLVVALLLTMAFSTSSMHQMKRAQNEITRAQQKWFAEGGLECALSVSYQDETTFNYDNIAYDDCTKNSVIDNSILSVSAKRITSTKHELRSSIVDGVKLHRQYQKSSIAGLSAIEAASDLHIYGTIEISPATLEDTRTVDDTYSCSSIKFKTKLYSSNINTIMPTNPFEGFSATWPSTCKPDYKTVTGPTYLVAPPVGGIFTPPTSVKKDISFEPGLNPFYRRFERDRSDWKAVSQDKREFDIILNNPGANCDAQIANALPSKPRIWINGDCDLGSATHSQTKLQDTSTPKLIVIANGIFHTSAAFSMYGTLYHFFENPVPADPARTAQWYSIPGTQLTWSVFPELTGADHHRVVYYTSGSFFPTGGYVMDAPEGVALIKASTKLMFDFAALAPPSYRTSWVKGSWRDYD
ncbi:hypothetical protein VST7929_00568 [Vibrio stylophorae]|uniref:Type 4 fimbrial biogenesis protein PilX N-terminal domain-containing protein n=1 Tax=Vibrio stylophorae TaxID=659351 RepID=A0ABM8ZQY9_9VIBR|nr:hypothetical protein [Vibrio stylophorae]CAH0532723.1 hypothetical protein VST7929_00568 [Vibrio stylophorae]